MQIISSVYSMLTVGKVPSSQSQFFSPHSTTKFWNSESLSPFLEDFQTRAHPYPQFTDTAL